MRSAGGTKLLRGIFPALLLAFLSMYCDDGGCVSPWYEPDPEVQCGPPVVEDSKDYRNPITGRPVVLRPHVRLPPGDMILCQTDLITLTYQWEQVSGPAVVEFEGAEYKQPSFVPPRAGEYVFRCRANYPRCESEKKCSSEWATFTVQVGELVESRDCVAPFADAGPGQRIATTAGTPISVSLDGTASHADAGWGCGGIVLSAYSWSVRSQPAGSDVTIQPAGQALAAVDLSIPGSYQFQLAVEDSAGRTGSDTVRVELAERSSCEDSLAVGVVPALSDVQVTVIDSAGATHQATTDANGEASFSGLAPGRRQSITAREGGENPRHEITTVLDHCSGEITIPLRQTVSARAAGRGTITARVPSRLFDLLPEPPLPFMIARLCWFGCESRPKYRYADSAQIRAAVLIPVQDTRGIDSLSFNDLFAPPFEEGALFPGNLAADDTFTFYLAGGSYGSLSGLSHYGARCSSADDCPDDDVHCVLTYEAEYRCRDFAPMRNLKMEAPAGDGVRLALVLGIADLANTELPTMAGIVNRIMFMPEAETPGLGGIEVFRYRALHVCPVTVDVAPGSLTDVTGVLDAIALEKCFSIDYQTQEVVEPFYYQGDIDPANTCQSDGDCGWPESGERCLSCPGDSRNRCCLPVVFRQRIVSDDGIIIRSNPGGFDPASPASDLRLCSWLPDSAPYEVMCEVDGSYRSCDPPRIEELQVPDDTECSLRYGFALSAIDFPVGHALLPEGGRMVVGFDFNHTEYTRESESRLLVPYVEGTSVTAAQFFTRNIEMVPLSSYRVLPGRFGAATTSRSNKGTVDLPPFPEFPSSDCPDAGMEVEVTFVSDPPTRWPQPEILRSYSAATGMIDPRPGTHDLPVEIAGLVAPGSELISLVIARPDGTDTWRIYSPPGTDRISLPLGLGPFESGAELWLTLQGSDFPVPFDYDLFPPDLLQDGPAAFSRDSYILVVP